ncbi:putative MATE family efflux protein [Paenibacillus phyllosphaerae]|uniref:Putative MATE family efflux protein n=1 Tax=Paenibacillus phyllosphaerae TaxID=274593 RepID=A0A7W5B3X6_9BACL|nr:MATE family efflux transporter [Paenibacillus phyllosphaerae]MBB3113955.1 putative MATE family efflux protein [Paenibacillus phyllosphaerae]
MVKGLDRKFTLWALAWPIFIEVFLQTLLGTVDTLMVSEISDDAVAVVGYSNQLFNALMTLFITVASGAGILIAQRIGAKKEEDARTIGIMSVSVSGAIGLVISAVLFFWPQTIAKLLNMPEDLMPLADTYISIAGAGMVLTAVMAALSTAIRNTGNTRGPMYVIIGVNIIHVIMNYGFIYGAFGFPVWELKGVAVSTLASRVIATVVLIMMFLPAFSRRITLPEFLRFDRKLFQEVLKIGWPLGVNMSCWVFTQLLIYMFIAMLGAAELAARTYMNTLESFCFMLGYSFALALQIQVAHLFGASRTREAYQATYRAMYIGLVVVTVNALVIFLVGGWLLGLFTEDKEIITIGVSLLGMNLLLQPGKMINMALGNALNAVGETRFTKYISIGSMWLIAAGASYVAGISLGWGLIGIYGCMIADEYLRGLLSFFRWRSRRWMTRSQAPASANASGGATAKA